MAKIDIYLNAMISVGGSIMHLAGGRKPMFRLNDELTDFDADNLTSAEVTDLLKEICPANVWAKFQETNDVDFTYDLENIARFRCNYFKERSGHGAVLQYLPTKVASLDDIDAPVVFKDICHLPGGLVLVCGQDGSGTSVTRAAMIEYMNENTPRYIINISTLIEFSHQAKRSVVEHCETTREQIADTLEAALNSHPDVIVLATMPDARTMRLALRAAMMGILVIATLPCSNGAKGIKQIISSFPEADRSEVRTLLAESTQAILSQVSCHASKGGRVTCREILLRAGGVPSAIMEGNYNSLYEIMDTYRKQGMCSMDLGLRNLLAVGEITAEEAYAKSLDKKQFQNFLVVH